MANDQLISDARAKIIWGEPASDVRAYLVSNGMPDTEADAVIQEFSGERNTEIRRIGTKNTVIGAVLVGVSGIAIYLMFARSSDRDMLVSTAKVVGALACVGLFGLWKLLNGITYLVRPQSEDKSITDLAE
jgi:hypothetical protein